jgi:hypothetical protein
VSELEVVAPAFVEMAHRIVWCSVATVDHQGRPRSRILHPLWEWDGTSLVGWIATGPTPTKRSHLARSPFVSCSADWYFDDATRIAVWDKFVNAPPPVGYDPSLIPSWDSPTAEAFAVLRLEPWRLRVFPGKYLLTGGSDGEVLVWSAPESQGATEPVHGPV